MLIKSHEKWKSNTTLFLCPLPNMGMLASDFLGDPEKLEAQNHVEWWGFRVPTDPVIFCTVLGPGSGQCLHFFQNQFIGGGL